MGLSHCGDGGGGYSANHDYSPDRDDSVDYDALRRIVKRSAVAMISAVAAVVTGRGWR